MAVTRDLVLVDMSDIAALAEARALVRLLSDAGVAAPPGPCAASLALVRREAVAVSALLAEGLRARESEEEIRRLRDACMVLSDVRALSWRAVGEGLLSPPMFDELMAVTSRCRREIVAVEVAARRRARRRIDQQ